MRGGNLNSVAQHGQHKHNKRRTVTEPGTVIDRCVVIGLMGIHQALHRHMRKQRMPTAQDQGLPQPAHAPIAICKGGWSVASSQCNKSRISFATTIGRRCHVHHLLALHLPYAEITEASLAAG